MQRARCLVGLLLLSLVASAGERISIYPKEIALTGWSPQQQLAVTLHHTNGRLEDVTHRVKWNLANTGFARLLARGAIIASGDGRTKLTATLKELTTTVAVSAQSISEPPQVHFVNDIMPILSKLNCNGGGCHGKQSGQNGFKLSVFGFDPLADYDALVREARGRRIFPAAPKKSLIIAKAVGAVPHGGGKRTTIESLDVALLTRWIEQGMPWGTDDAPTVERIEVFPPERQVRAKAEQQLVVTAYYSDGTRRDVTDAASYTSNAETVGNVDHPGHALTGEIAGEAAITINYMGRVAAARLIIPQLKPIPEQNVLAASKLPIDTLVADRLNKLQIHPSELCDDATFLRRLYLTTIGTLPTAEESVAFAKSKDPAKRSRAIDEVLKRPEFADYWALKWSNILMVNPEQLGELGAFRFHSWLKKQMAANRRYDEWVRELLTASGNSGKYGPANFYRVQRTNEDVTKSVSQAFLGIRMDCAQCHHHPFDRWGQEDFYGLAGFFNNLKRESAGANREFIYHDGYQPTQIPVKNIAVSTQVPGGTPMDPAKLSEMSDPRAALAQWVTKKGNPYFARLVANRLWKNFLGRGLVEPEDDLRLTNPPTNEPLLNHLAERVEANDFDLRSVMREILNSRTFQLTSDVNGSNDEDRQNFSHYYRRRMPAEVLLDAISQVTEHAEPLAGHPLGTRSIQVWDNRLPSYFLDTFGRSERRSPCECGTSGEPTMAQALHLMNAPEIQRKLEFRDGSIRRLLKQGKKPIDIVNDLTLASLGRMPSAKEVQIAERLFAQPDTAQAAEDYLWTLLNSYDFLFIK